LMGMERCRRSSETPDFGDDAEEVSPPPFVHKQFNPACDARRSLRNVYVGDPVLEDVVEISDNASRKAAITTGAWLLLPTSWFEYLDTMAMPLSVTAQVVKKVKADKPAYEVKMVGDGEPSISVTYFLEKHPRAYEGMEERYLLNPSVQFLSKAPPVA